MKRLSRTLQETIRSLPLRPGVYLFKDDEGRPLYIGKALLLRKRVMDHFRKFGENFSKESAMLEHVRKIDIIETPTEAEALLLEASLVKEYLPRYNQDLKDDKSYPFLKVTAEEYPRLIVTRGRKADGGKYFGPYTSLLLLRQAVRMLRREFPLRTCKTLPKRVCLMFHIGQCGGPCEGHQRRQAYLETVKELEHFLLGRRDVMVRTLSRRMKDYIQKRDYEKAQIVYQEIKALSSISTRPRPFDSDRVLADFKEAMALPTLPARIECFDISNISGKEAVGSLVVFIDGRPARSQYRRFRIRTVRGIDDYKMMQEVVRRRYTRALEEKQVLPDLVVIDGGKGHLSAARTVLVALGLAGLPVIAIAKQHEYLFKPDRETPYIFSQSSPFLEMVRRLRDEAHRFAITYHRKLHKKEALVSLLDAVPGVGPKTRDKLLRRVGPVSKIKTLSEAELVEKGGMSARTARNIKEALFGP